MTFKANKHLTYLVEFPSLLGFLGLNIISLVGIQFPGVKTELLQGTS